MIIIPSRSRRKRGPRQQVAAIVAVVVAIIAAGNVAFLRTFRGFPQRTVATGQSWFLWALLAVVVAGVAAVIVIVVRRNADTPSAHADDGDQDDAHEDGNRVKRMILVAIALMIAALAFGVATYRAGRVRVPAITPAANSSIRPEG
jgi:H+/Cl- antiporter ClcA